MKAESGARAWSLVGYLHRVITASEQPAMSARAHAHIIKVAAGDLSMITHPDVATDVIIQAAKAHA